MACFWGVAVVLVGSTALGCSGRSNTPELADAGARSEIHALLDNIAHAISSRDAREIARRMPSDSSIVYVSDGLPIRGSELEAVLENFYATQRTIDFRWDSMILTPRSSEVWTVTAWADIRLVDTAGAGTTAPALFTWTVMRRGGRWQPVMAHKATLSQK
jgi:hypothetical protein